MSAALISDILPVMQWVKRWVWNHAPKRLQLFWWNEKGYRDWIQLRIKPLDCPVCLGFWLGVCFSLKNPAFLSVQTVITISASAILALWITQITRKLQ